MYNDGYNNFPNVVGVTDANNDGYLELDLVKAIKL